MMNKCDEINCWNRLHWQTLHTMFVLLIAIDFPLIQKYQCKPSLRVSTRMQRACKLCQQKQVILSICTRSYEFSVQSFRLWQAKVHFKINKSNGFLFDISKHSICKFWTISMLCTVCPAMTWSAVTAHVWFKLKHVANWWCCKWSVSGNAPTWMTKLMESLITTMNYTLQCDDDGDGNVDEQKIALLIDKHHLFI